MKTINAIRMLGMAQINKANSGHPGIVLGAAPIIHEVYMNHLVTNPDEPMWFNRDRFVLAAGHGSSMLYATLHLAGFNLGMDDLKEFRQWGSLTPGHPEYGHTEGVDATSGPLGQGIPMGIGMAISQMHMAAKYNKPEFELFNYHTFVLCGDGDLQEGVTQEAMSLAGHLGVNKLIVLYDSNDIQLDGPVDMTNSEDTRKKYEAMGWFYELVEDGNNVGAINVAIGLAKAQSRPAIIEIKTVIGYGSIDEGDSSTHGAPLGGEKTDLLRERLNWEYADFEVPEDVYEDYSIIKARGKEMYDHSVELLASYKEKYPNEYEELTATIFTSIVKFPDDLNEATRASGGKIINELSEDIPYLMGGSADLTKSTKAKGVDGDFSKDNPLGRNINYGVREHAMGAICNGMTLCGMKAFTGGFFVFSDYMKPSIRMAALMDIPTTFVFTHDSVAVGEDGPTHEPIEQLTGLRAIPNLNVMRPANANEAACAWKNALDSESTPSVIVLTRQNLLNNAGSRYEYFKKGAYVISKEKDRLDGVLLASGSEVNLSIQAQAELLADGIDVRVVSIPSIYLYEKQPAEYKSNLLPNVPTLAVEMATAYEYYKYADEVYNITKFGASAPGGEVIEKYGFTSNEVAKAFKTLWSK